MAGRMLKDGGSNSFGYSLDTKVIPWPLTARPSSRFCPNRITLFDSGLVMAYTYHSRTNPDD